MDNIKFIENAENILASRYSKYSEYSNQIQECINAWLKGSSLKNLSVQSRVKSKDSLKEKIYRKNYCNKYDDGEKFINDLPDGIGIRIICMLNSEEEQVYTYLKNKLNDIEAYNNHNYSINGLEPLLIDFEKQPEIQKNGHKIYRMNGVYKSDGKFIRIELQIKSMVHHFLGELEHSMFYKNYKYIIANEFYTQLMNNINNELEIIDRQMEALKSHMNKTDTNQAKEIMQIAALMLYNKFSKKTHDHLDCEIDLREVYEINAEIIFANPADVNRNVIQLNKLMDDLQRLSDTELDFNFEKGNISDKKTSRETERLVSILDQILESGDVYWEYFIKIYTYINKNENYDYTKTLVNISDRFLKMISVFREDVDSFEDDAFFNDFNEVVISSLVETFNYVRKLSFFLPTAYLSKINNFIKTFVGDYQLLVSNEQVETFNKNKDTIQFYIVLNCLYICDKIVDKKYLDDAVGCFEIINDYQLKINDDILKWIKEKYIFTEDEWLSFEFVMKGAEASGI